MENMEDFEGIKRIKNTNNFSTEFIYNCLKQYEKAIGTVELEANTIIADVAGKYEIEIFLNNDSIVVQRRIEEGKKEDKINFGEELKSVDMSQADRMVEQIYDFLKTLSLDGKSKEPITGVKKIFYVKQKEGTFRNAFTVTTEKGEEVYEIKGNKILKEFVVNNIKAAKDSNSKIYTEEEYILTNCSLSEDETKIIVNTDEVTEASIQIQGGKADGTKFTANIIVDTTPPELEIEYSTTEPTEENVIVTIIANEEIQIPDGWIEGEDKNIIYKEYDANTEEIVVIKDLAGNETEANIKIENIIKKGNNGQNADQTSGDETLADKEYPAAGIGKILLICIGVIIITGTIGFIKNKKYKNI